jgi:hemerythrin superfamily protein
VNVYFAIRLLGNEHRQMEALRRFMAGRAALAPERESPAQAKLAELMAEFQERLERHNHVEEHVLFPKARDLEKSLYDSAIAGAAASRSPSP